jgi:hypothetical protein
MLGAAIETTRPFNRTLGPITLIAERALAVAERTIAAARDFRCACNACSRARTRPEVDCRACNRARTRLELRLQRLRSRLLALRTGLYDLRSLREYLYMSSKPEIRLLFTSEVRWKEIGAALARVLGEVLADAAAERPRHGRNCPKISDHATGGSNPLAFRPRFLAPATPPGSPGVRGTSFCTWNRR